MSDPSNQNSSLSFKKEALNDQDTNASNASSESIKAVAVYEIIKGISASASAIALWIWHKDLDQWLTTIKASWQQQFGQSLATQVDSAVTMAQKASQNWTLFLFFIIVYASIRFIEAYGLWQDKTWAYWFSVIGYGIFIPVEIYYLVTSAFDWFKLGILVLNVIIVIVVFRNMKKKNLI